MQKNKNYELIVFDLDGTLMKSDTTIYNTMIETLQALNLKADIPHQKFIDFIGYHFKDIFEYFDIKVDDLNYFIDVYKKNYYKNLDDTKLYPGVIDLLKSLKDYDIKTAILTTKAQDQLEKIIDYFKLNDYFDLLLGRRDGMQIKPDPEPLLWIIKQLKVDHSKTLIVGDTELDIKCGTRANVDTCYLEYGYGKLNGIEPKYTFQNILQILEIIWKKYCLS